MLPDSLVYQYQAYTVPPIVIDSGVEPEIFIFTSTIISFTNRLLYKAIQEPPLGSAQGLGTGEEFWAQVFQDQVYDIYRVAALLSPPNTEWFFFDNDPIPTPNTESLRWTDPQPVSLRVSPATRKIAPAIRTIRPY